jgi:hypothetical protein
MHLVCKPSRDGEGRALLLKKGACVEWRRQSGMGGLGLSAADVEARAEHFLGVLGLQPREKYRCISIAVHSR